MPATMMIKPVKMHKECEICHVNLRATIIIICKPIGSAWRRPRGAATNFYSRKTFTGKKPTLQAPEGSLAGSSCAHFNGTLNISALVRYSPSDSSASATSEN